MSGIGSLGRDSTLRYFMQGTKHSIVTRNCGTLESYYIDSPVLHQEASLQKVCALEKNEAAKKLIIFSCTPMYERTTTVPLLTILLLYGLVRTANNAAIRAYILLFQEQKV